MSATRDVGRAPVADAPDRTPVTPLRILRVVLLPVSIIFWAVGVADTDVSHLGVYGLPAALSPIFYLGLVLLLVSAGIEFAQAKLSEPRLAAHAVALTLMLYGTAGLVYQEGRFPWLYKTAGVIQYVSDYGSLNHSIDIYMNWPGFFALSAWFDNVAGIGNALDYGKWAEVVFELAAIPLLYTIYQSISLPPWHRWVGIMMYMSSNWIAQDYLSPQALSTLLSLGILALATRWMFVVNYAPQQRGAEASSAKYGRIRRRDLLIPPLRRSAPFIVALVFLYFALVETHELSPYIVAIQLALLSATGLARPRWVAPLVGVVALLYLVPNFAYVNSHYGVTGSIGDFFSNIQTSTAADANSAPVPQSHHIIADCTFLLSAGMWILAAVGAWLRRKARRIVVALVLLTYSPILVLVAGGYGSEGILRVYLFSLPWAAALAAIALAPLRAPVARQRSDAPVGAAAVPAGRSPLRAVLPIAIAVALFLPSFYGNDSSDEMTQAEVNTMLSFEKTAAPGPVFAVLENFPFSDLANYYQFPVGTLFGGVEDGAVLANTKVTPTIAAFLARSIVGYTGGGPAYIVETPSMEAFNVAMGQTSSQTYNTLLSSMAKSPYWKAVVKQDGIYVYQLNADAAKKMKPGPFEKNVGAAVP